MSSKPKVSVIMSVYNGQAYLREAVTGMLGQTFRDFEFIIINDASTDSSAEIISSFSDKRIKVINNKQNLGLTKSLNIGLQQARGEYLARMDDDDIALPERLRTQLDYLENNPDTALIGSWAERINQQGKVIGYEKPFSDIDLLKFSLLFTRPAFLHGTFFFRKAVILNEFGGYNEDYVSAQDFDLVSRLVRNHKITNIPQVLQKFRVHPGSVTKALKEKNILALDGVRVFYENFNYYTQVSRAEFDDYYLAKVQQVRDGQQLKVALGVFERVYRAFIDKEGFDFEQVKKIEPLYKQARQQLVKWGLKAKFPRFYRGLKLLLRGTSK